MGRVSSIQVCLGLFLTLCKALSFGSFHQLHSITDVSPYNLRRTITCALMVGDRQVWNNANCAKWFPNLLSKIGPTPRLAKYCQEKTKVANVGNHEVMPCFYDNGNQMLTMSSQ